MFTCCFCYGKYDPTKARAEFRGLCSMACQHSFAKKLGYKKNDPNGRTEWEVLSDPLRRLRRTIPGADPVTEQG